MRRPYLGGVSLDGQGCVDRQHFEQEGKLALEYIFDLGAQAPRVVCDPLAQGPLGNAIIQNHCVAFGMSSHPELEGKEEKEKRDPFA